MGNEFGIAVEQGCGSGWQGCDPGRDVTLAGMLHLAGDVHPTKLKMGKKFLRRIGRIRSTRRALIPLGGRLGGDALAWKGIFLPACTFLPSAVFTRRHQEKSQVGWTSPCRVRPRCCSPLLLNLGVFSLIPLLCAVYTP